MLREASDRYGRPIYLLSDEAYRLIALDGRRAPSPAEHYERTLVLYSYGKQLLAPGQRIGYLALSPRIPDEERATLREAVRIAQFVNSYSWPNALLQRALPDIADLVVDIAALERRRDRLVPALAELGYEPTTPEGTFYVLARSPIEDDVAFVARLAEDDVFVLPGSTINLPGWFRISLTASDEMIEASIARFAAAPGARPGLRLRPSSRLRIASAAIVTYVVEPRLRVRRRVRLVDRLAHVDEPAVTLEGADREREVARTQPRVATLVAVRRGAAPVLAEEQRQPPPRTDEVRVVRVQRQEDVIGLDAVVEPVDEPVEERLPTDLLEEGRLLGHRHRV